MSPKIKKMFGGLRFKLCHHLLSPHGSLCIILLYLVNKSNAVIYHLNASEYERMPPLFTLDAYEPCLRPERGLYCMLELDLRGAPDSQLMNLIKNYSAYTVKHYNHTYLQRGVCVQETCQKYISSGYLNNSEDLKMALEVCLNESIWKEYGLEANVKELNYCNKHEDVDQKDASDWIVAGGFIIIVVANVFGTSYDILLNRVKKENNSNCNQYLLSFSLLQNWRWLTSSNATDPRIERLKGLHCYKTVGIIMMIMAHVIWVISNGFTVNTHDFEKVYETTHFQLLFNGLMIVQLFFVHSGFLMAYNLLLRSESRAVTWRDIPKILFLRWWRLTPAYAAVLAFTATWLRHCGAGPLWRLWLADCVSADCRAYWWLHLLYANNYVSDDRFCMIQSWYLGADMQIFAVSLVVFLGLRSRWLGLVLLALLGLAAPALHVWLQDLDAVVIMNPEFYRKKTSLTFEVHVLGHNYLACSAVGMATACLLYRLQNNGLDKRKNKLLQILSWCCLPAMLCLFLAGRVFYGEQRAALPTRVAWAAGHRLLMSGIVTFAISSLFMRFNETYCSVVEWRGWAVSGRLAYSVYLLHLNLLHVLVSIRGTLAEVSFYYMIIVYFGVVSISFTAAVPFHLLLEAPAARLMKTFLSSPPQHKVLETNTLRVNDMVLSSQQSHK